MKVKLMALSALMAAGCLCACNNDDNNNTTMVNATDSTYVIMAATSNTAEIDASNVALTKSGDTAIQHYAQMMIADHTLAQTDLKTLAAKHGLTAPDSLDAYHVALKTQLYLLSGRAFDSAYITNQVVDHQKTIALFQTEVNSGNNADLKNFANSKLPTLQMHLDHATMLAAQYP